LKRIPVTSAPAHLVEHIHMTITDHVYQSIRVINKIAGGAAAGTIANLQSFANAQDTFVD
jgi:hypothetical protein